MTIIFQGIMIFAAFDPGLFANGYLVQKPPFGSCRAPPFQGSSLYLTVTRAG
jgi:hypothetical protein